MPNRFPFRGQPLLIVDTAARSGHDSRMPRLARAVAPGLPRHVVQRGNRRQDVFFCDEDREAYLSFLRDACERFGVEVRGWCLMTNHVHVIAVPEGDASLGRAFSDAHVSYTRMVNFREGWRGHLWQGRFGSSPLDERRAVAALRYVERNPVRAGLRRVPWRYEWSSAAFHAGEADADPLVASRDGWFAELAAGWREFLTQPDEEGFVARIRREAAAGRPVGAASFVAGLERRLKRNLTRGRPGRPRKKRRGN